MERRTISGQVLIFHKRGRQWVLRASTLPPYSFVTMVTARLKPPGEAESAAAVEAAFYDALRQGDLDAVMACWGDDDEMVCVHPGGARLIGLSAIRDSFAAMLAEGGVDLEPCQIRRLAGAGLALHSVMERVGIEIDGHPGHGWVVATNVFQRTAIGWRLIAHHASGAPGPEPEVPPGRRLLH